MSLDVVVVDLGVGNLSNVERALVAAGGAPRRSSDPELLDAAKRIVLPGVGAFRPPRERLRGELEKRLDVAITRGANVLGICVGFQLLFQASEEFGETDGLRRLAGRVRQLPSDVSRPHIGWNRLRIVAKHPLLEGIEDGAYVYYVHSFAPETTLETLAVTNHGCEFAAIAAREGICGAQFHPEKSGDAGLRLLSNFLRLPNGEPPIPF